MRPLIPDNSLFLHTLSPESTASQSVYKQDGVTHATTLAHTPRFPLSGSWAGSLTWSRTLSCRSDPGRCLELGSLFPVTYWSQTVPFSEKWRVVNTPAQRLEDSSKQHPFPSHNWKSPILKGPETTPPINRSWVCKKDQLPLQSLSHHASTTSTSFRSLIPNGATSGQKFNPHGYLRLLINTWMFGMPASEYKYPYVVETIFNNGGRRKGVSRRSGDLPEWSHRPRSV